LERSFVIIKPDGTARRRVSALVLKALLDRGYRLVAFQEMKVPESLAKLHYAVHKEKPFFSWLVDFISSAPVLTMIFESDDVIQDVRDALVLEPHLYRRHPPNLSEENMVSGQELTLLMHQMPPKQLQKR